MNVDRYVSLLADSDLLRCQRAGSGKLTDARGTAEPALQLALHPAHTHRAFLDRTADLDRAVIAQKTADLPGNLGNGISRKLVPARRVKAAHRLDEADTGKLIQIVRLRAAPEIPPRDGME